MWDDRRRELLRVWQSAIAGRDLAAGEAASAALWFVREMGLSREDLVEFVEKFASADAASSEAGTAYAAYVDSLPAVA